MALVEFEFIVLYSWVYIEERLMLCHEIITLLILKKIDPPLLSKSFFL